MGKRNRRHRRNRLVTKHPREVGASPGLEPAPRPESDSDANLDLRVMGYGPESLVELDSIKLAALKELVGKHTVTWIHLQSTDDQTTLRHLGSMFGFHPLALEDVANPVQRPKVEDYDKHLFLVLRIPWLQEHLAFEQVSLFLAPGVVVTVQEGGRESFEAIRRRIRSSKGRIRKRAADYLAYAVIDTVIDHYYPVLEDYGDRIEELESRLIGSSAPVDSVEIHAVKQDLYALRRSLWPCRETLGSLARSTDDHFLPETRTYLRDCHDHAAQLSDVVEACREMSAGLMELHLSNLSQGMNEVMKVLTLISTIFIPLGFIAGLYGMNFDRTSPWNMPELGWRFGYPIALVLMGVTAIGFLFFFRRKGWLGSSDRRESERNSG